MNTRRGRPPIERQMCLSIMFFYELRVCMFLAIKNVILDIFHKIIKRKLFIATLLSIFIFYLLGPYVLVFTGIKVLELGRGSSRGGFIKLPLFHILLGRSLIFLGHNMSSKGTFFIIAHGKPLDKEQALRILEEYPTTSYINELIPILKAEKDVNIREAMIVTIGKCNDDKALPFLVDLYENGEDIALIAICKMNTPLSKKKLLSIYMKSRKLFEKEEILFSMNHSFNFSREIILKEKDEKLRGKAFRNLLISLNKVFNQKNTNDLCPLNEACEDWTYKDDFSSDDITKTFERHPELSLEDRKFLLLGHAVLRNPDSIPFLRNIIKDNKSEELRELAKQILKVIPNKKKALKADVGTAKPRPLI